MARGKSWDLDSKLDAAMAYVMTGYSDQASKLCGIPERTIRDWTQQEWFQELLKEARACKQEELDGQWTGIIHKASTQIIERINIGDPVVNPKTKEITYVPVKAKELAVISAILADKRALLRGQATSRVEKITKTEKHLEDIAKVLEGAGIPIEDSAEEV